MKYLIFVFTFAVIAAIACESDSGDSVNAPTANPTVVAPEQPTATVDLSTPTPAATPTPELTLQWIEAARFGGNSITNTETFSVSSDRWRLRWSTEPGSLGAMNFIVFVHRESGGLYAAAANVIGRSSGSSVFRLPGDYFLEIITGQPYGIFIEEERLAPVPTPTPTPEPTPTPRTVPRDVLSGRSYELHAPADRGSIYYTWSQVIPDALSGYRPQRNLTTQERLDGLRIPPVINCIQLPRTAPPNVGLTWIKDGPPIPVGAILIGIETFHTDLQCLEPIGRFELTMDNGEKALVWLPLSDLYIGGE